MHQLPRAVLALCLLSCVGAARLLRRNMRGVVIVVIDAIRSCSTRSLSASGRAFLKIRLAILTRRKRPGLCDAARTRYHPVINQRWRSARRDDVGRTIDVFSRGAGQRRTGAVWIGPGHPRAACHAISREARHRERGCGKTLEPMPPWAWPGAVSIFF